MSTNPHRAIIRSLPLLILSLATTFSVHAAETIPPHPDTNKGITLDARVTPMPTLPHGPFVHLDDGKILGVHGEDAIVSADGGKTWARYPIFGPDAEMTIRPERALIRTKQGTVVLLFINDAVRHYAWDKEKNVPKEAMHLPSYSIRSTDGGKTWTDLSLLHDGWCGCLQDVIQTERGAIVVPGQEMLYKEGRHATMPYVSTDEGETWQRTRFLDIGGQGDHAGAIEGTLVQRRDGKLWLLLRSYHGYFYESFSSDDGLTWSDPKPSAIHSTGSPGKLVRLQSGRLCLLWNALPSEGFKRREELFLSLSEDDGASWSPARVIARNKGGRVSYPHVFEYAPGELWITTMQGDLRARLSEKDFVVPWTTIVAFGDSTTAPRGHLSIYADILERELPEGGVEARVINAGVPSNTTADGRKRFEADVLARDPELVVIQFGINDAAVDVWKDPPATAPRVALAQYEANLRWFIDALQQRDITPILMSPNPMRWAEKTRKLYGRAPYDPASADGFNVLLRDYAAAAKAVAADTGVPFIDVYGIFQAVDGEEGSSMDDLLLDGMHPNAAGHRLVANALMEVIVARKMEALGLE